jgi:hypothetical protein
MPAAINLGRQSSRVKGAATVSELAIPRVFPVMLTPHRLSISRSYNAFPLRCRMLLEKAGATVARLRVDTPG